MADGSGGHVFAATYDDHLKNVARWRQYQKEQATIPPPSATGGDEAPAQSSRAPQEAQKSATGNAMPKQPPMPPEKGGKRTGQTEKGSRTQ